MMNLLHHSPSISIKKFEQDVKKIEGIPIILRCPSTQKIVEYSYQKATSNSWTLKRWLSKRIEAYSCEIEIVILTPEGKKAHLGMTMKTLRKLYTTF